MGNHKKPKTQHLDDAEIWDDSALIRSWDEAVAEYMYYHSIHARGEDVEEVLRQAELEEAAYANSPTATKEKRVSVGKDASVDEDFEEGEVEDYDADVFMAPAVEGVDPKHESAKSAEQPRANGVADNTHDNSSQPRSAAIGTNPALENIKMAYWWAGYYSGLYEGQQQAAPT